MALTAITNFLAISERLLTGGMPTWKQLFLLKNAGVETVINLTPDDSPKALKDEKSVVAECGLEYIHIPVIWEQPCLTDLSLFFQTMDARVNHTIFIHCVLNMRVSVFVYLYRRICQNMPEKLAYTPVLQIWTPNPTWEAFISSALAHYHG